MVIKKLDPETINLISAGEVIESPADILKELIENAVDAGSDKINIVIKNSGIDHLEIRDNGCGISQEDLNICLERHTTSKLISADDLFSLNSFGFRGEALASINAVSNLKIISSTNDSGEGNLLECGVIKSHPSQKGTTLIIQDLFDKVPVRKKFLKSKSLEFSRIYDVFVAYSLMYPEINFSFNSEKKNINLSKTNLDNRIIQIFGKDIKLKTIPIEINNTLFKLKGYVSNPSKPIFLPNSYLFINNRFVYSTQIYKAISSAYKDYLMVQQKPFFIAFLEIDSKTVDVNVHPKKRFVKLFNEMLFISELKKELTSILDKHLGKSISNELDNFRSFAKFDTSSNYFKSPSNSQSFSPSSLKDFSSNKFQEKSVFNQTSNFLEKQNTFFNSENYKDNKIKLIDKEITRFVGQIHQTYIVCETKDGFLFIDQHAADERINLEENRNKYSNSFNKQKLISPISVNFSSEQIDFLKNNLSVFDRLGFEFNLEFTDKIEIIATPIFLNRQFDKNYFLNIFRDLENGENTVEVLMDNLIKLKSCKQSIKAKQALTLPEQIELVKKLSKVENSVICAHGRPSVIYLSINDLDKMFHRII